MIPFDARHRAFPVPITACRADAVV